jgi:hypothetical protein
MRSQKIEISNNDYWFKIVDILQQNWAIIESDQKELGCIVYFISDNSGVFDQIEFDNIDEAQRQLRINGFGKYQEDEKAKNFVIPPLPPFHKSSHPNGQIYSSGKFWQTR